MINEKNIAFYTHNDKRICNDYLFLNYTISNVYVKLAKNLEDLGFKVHTLDVYVSENIDPEICIFLDIPPDNISQIINTSKTISIVMLREADMILKRNYDQNRHDEFDFILTWKSKLIDNKKYFFFPSTKFNISNKVNVDDYLNRKLCSLINSNIKSSIYGELYSKRLEIIKWFEKHHLDDFDLFGFGWNKRIISLFGRTIFKTKIFAPKRLSYKGVVDNKFDTLKQYKFAICFENTNNIEDYISEKIFDCFLAGVVPIYWGDPNIKSNIPSNCFIDFRNFKTYDEMYKFIKNMPNNTYLRYIENINNYLDREMAQKFSLDNWFKSIESMVLLCTRRLK